MIRECLFCGTRYASDPVLFICPVCEQTAQADALAGLLREVSRLPRNKQPCRDEAAVSVVVTDGILRDIDAALAAFDAARGGE